jgi:hypothetical protein
MEEELATKIRSTYIYFGSLYFVSVGVLDLWGFWTPFRVNALDYVSLSDVLRVATIPLLSTFAFLALGSILGEYLGPHNQLPPGGGANTRVGRFLHKLQAYQGYFRAAWFVVTMGLILFAPSAWESLIPWLLAMPFYFLAKQRGLFATILPDEKARSIAVYLFCVLPFWSYGHGRAAADHIIHGTDYHYVVANTVPSLPPVNATERTKYLGQIGDYVFFLLPDNSTLAILQFSQTKGILIRHCWAKVGTTECQKPTVIGGLAI